MMRYCFLSLAGILWGSGTLVAQVQNGQAPPPPDNPPALLAGQAGAPLTVAPAQQRPQARPANLGVLSQLHSGSLLQASLLLPTDADQVKLGDISFYSVDPLKPKTLKKHDLITIVVHEQSTAASTGTTDLKKNADLDAKLNNYIDLNGLKLNANTPAIAPEINLSGTRDFKGEATVNRSDTVEGRITAEVLDVKPNGVLVLQARKRIKNDEDEQEFSMTGMCRAEDLTPDNTVLSAQMYDMAFAKLSKGPVRDTSKRGWIPRLLDFVNPF